MPMLAFANSRPSSGSPFHSCLNPHGSYETELKIAEIITLGIYYARLVSKNTCTSRFVGFAFVFLVLTTVGGVFLRMICTIGHIMAGIS